MLIIIQGCSPSVENQNPNCCFERDVFSDKAFQPYKQKFELYSGVNTKGFPVYFANLNAGTAGICYRIRFLNGLFEWKYIEIDQEYWKSISEYQKINLMFHELGHCVLGRQHIEWQDLVTVCPPSFMYGSVISTECIEKNYDLYLEEMFQKQEK